MNVIHFFSAENQRHWIEEIQNSDWGAGQYLAQLLKEQRLKQLIGENSEVLLLADGDTLISFCTLAEKDDIQPTELTPWIGWVYTFPAYRGHHYMGKLLEHAETLAAAAGADHIYISTNHIGLYEKFGYNYYQTMKDVGGEDSRVYQKKL